MLLNRSTSSNYEIFTQVSGWILTVSADGAVPVLFKVTDGNTEDSPTHRETWMTIRRLEESPDFLCVADSKLCTGDNLLFIHSQWGSFVTVPPHRGKKVGFSKTGSKSTRPVGRKSLADPARSVRRGPGKSSRLWSLPSRMPTGSV